MKKIIGLILLVCVFAMSLNISISAFNLPIEPNTYSVTISFEKVIGGIEIGFTPVCKVLNGSWTSKEPSKIYYTLDGSDPKNGTLYKNDVPLTEAKTYTIRAIAIDEDSVWSIESNTKYTVEQLSTPKITSVIADGETYVNISADEGATIYYTTDLTTPTTKSAKYAKEIVLTDNARIKAIAVKKGYVTSNVAQDYITVEEIIKFTCAECGNVLSDTTLYSENGKAICEECYAEQKAKDNENELLIECDVCGKEIATDNVIYDENNQPLCQQCADEISNNKGQYIELECPHCSKILEIAEADYNERESIVCPDCMKFVVYEGEDTEYECSDCGEIFYYSDTKVVENGKIYCPYCNCIVDGDNIVTEAECYICGEYFNEDDLIRDEDSNLICQNCYDELQNEDEEVTYIECPYCEEIFEDNEDIYDEDGYAVCPYCEGLVEASEETPEEIEIEFITSEWATDEVYEAYQNNLIPDEMLNDILYDTITREEFTAIAIKLYENIIGEIPYADIYDIPFTDCNYESEYIAYIATAYTLGITKGTSQTTFSPYENISREQLATMLHRVIKLAGIDDIYDFDVNNVRKFYDDSEISDYARESVYFMAEYGIVKGVDGAHFAPLDTATKEQSILISVRCANNLYE